MPNESLDNLAKKVSEDTDVKNSAITVLSNLKATVDQVRAELADQKVQNETLDKLSTDLGSSSDALATAIANVPA